MRLSFQALIDRDIPALETLPAEEFLIVDVASGTVHSRRASLEAISGRMVTFKEIKTFPDETVIRRAGPGTGIVIGRTEMSFSDAEGALTEVASRYTHVFLDDGGTWRLVSAQGNSDLQRLTGACEAPTNFWGGQEEPLGVA